MKLFKAFILICSLLAGMAVASCFARGPHCHGYNYYGGRPNYYSYGTQFYTPYAPYGYYGAPPVIIIQPPNYGWQSGGIYGRNYYRFGN